MRLLIRIFSLLPLSVLYHIADLLLYPLIYYVARYRLQVVRQNLQASFPDKSPDECLQIEREFYHHFADILVEIVYGYRISDEEIRQRVVFENVEMVEDFAHQTHGVIVYLGHMGNWEWIASLPYWCPEDIKCGQIYHPLRNKDFDRLFLHLRGQFGGVCIPMKETLRKIIEMRRNKQKAIIGFISDQTPKWNSIHHWCDFLHRETPVFIGTEKIGKQVDALIYYGHVTRPKRGYYHCEFKPLTHDAKQVPDYELTDQFTHLLEQMIIEVPHIWLWTHKRWKRTKEEWNQRQQEQNKK